MKALRGGGSSAQNADDIEQYIYFIILYERGQI